MFDVAATGNRVQPSDWGDGALLRRFVKLHDGAAFAELIRRHGPMVLGVCRRTLGNEADAEDAFQAVFLVLVRKAASVRPAGLASWLYGVACNTAMKARTRGLRRKQRESQLASRMKPQCAEPTWSDVQPVIDRELNSLPEKYRSAIVLCDLEGKSLREAAEVLGCPIPTVGTRVARGRRLLARRLSRHGVTASAGVLALWLSQDAAMALVPTRLVEATTIVAVQNCTAGASLTSTLVACLTGLWATRLIAAGCLVFFAALAVGGVARGKAAYEQWSATSDATTPVRRRPPDGHRLDHTWAVVSVVRAGRELPPEAIARYGEWTFEIDRGLIKSSTLGAGSVRTDSSKRPHEIELALPASSVGAGLPRVIGKGYYRHENRMLVICLGGPGAAMPTGFDADRSDTTLFVLQRKKKTPPAPTTARP